MGIPVQLKPDNAPAYLSLTLHQFLNLWGITHVTGIPHSPTGQAIIERTHQTLKQLLIKQKEGEEGLVPQARIHKAVYVMNFLRLVGDAEDPPAVIHSQALGSGHQDLGKGVLVQYKDLESGVWKGPVELKFIGRGYVCVIAERGPQWIPARWIKPWRNTLGTVKENLVSVNELEELP